MSWFWRQGERKLPEFLRVPWSIRDLIVFVVAWMGIQVALVFLLGALSPYVAGVDHFLQALKNGDIVASFILNFVDAAVGFGVVSLYLHRYDVGWQAVGWRRVSPLKALGYIAGILVAFVALANVALWLTTALVPGFNANQAQDNQLIGAAGLHPNLALIGLVLLPPVLEETIFRGFLFPAISKRTGMVWGAIISSIIFGIAHWQANISIYTFILGLLLCYMYVRLKSIVPGIFLHMLNNYLAFLAVSGR